MADNGVAGKKLRISVLGDLWLVEMAINDLFLVVILMQGYVAVSKQCNYSAMPEHRIFHVPILLHNNGTGTELLFVLTTTCF